MVAKRIIPCLDVHEGKTVKGVNFKMIKEVGDPVEMGKYYSAQGADELVYLDISATTEGRKIFTGLVSRVASELNIPFTVGGGITSVDGASALLDSGADKVSVNSAALRTPNLVNSIAKKFGSQFIVVAIDARFIDGYWQVMAAGGMQPTDRELFEWAAEVASRGAGEILFTSVNHDGTKNGYACETLARLCDTINIPVIASGGAGTMDHFATVFEQGKADAALAASVFHNKEILISDLKKYLLNRGIKVRI